MHARRRTVVRVIVARAGVGVAHRINVRHLVLLLMGLVRALLLQRMELLLLGER